MMVYPYQQYGMGNGKVLYISPNSRVIDEKNQEFVYDALLTLDEYELKSKTGVFPLFTGLTVQAEIVVMYRGYRLRTAKLFGAFCFRLIALTKTRFRLYWSD